MKPSLVFFGNERLATSVTTTCPTLEALIAAGFDVKAVVASHQRASSRSARELEIEAVASRHHIPVLLTASLADITSELANLHADIGVLVAFGRLIPSSIIDLFPRGIINLHPSLLPLHRGPIPIESVILNGETTTGVSIMELARQMDAGPVWAQQIISLSPHQSKQALADQLLAEGANLLVQTLPVVLEGQRQASPQDDQAATVDQRLTKADGHIDWNKPAVQLEREVRAYLGWPGSFTTIVGRDVIITAAHVMPDATEQPGTVRASTELAVATSDGWLVIDRLKPAGKRDMAARDFIAGLPPGLR